MIKETAKQFLLEGGRVRCTRPPFHSCLSPRLVIPASLLTCHSRGNGNPENKHAVCLHTQCGTTPGPRIKSGVTRRERCHSGLDPESRNKMRKHFVIIIPISSHFVIPVSLLIVIPVKTGIQRVSTLFVCSHKGISPQRTSTILSTTYPQKIIPSP